MITIIKFADILTRFDNLTKILILLIGSEIVIKRKNLFEKSIMILDWHYEQNDIRVRLSI